MIYEFECKEHGIFEERWAKLGQETASCPKCGAISKKVMSVPASPIINGYSEANGYSDSKTSKKGKDS